MLCARRWLHLVAEASSLLNPNFPSPLSPGPSGLGWLHPLNPAGYKGGVDRELHSKAWLVNPLPACAWVMDQEQRHGRFGPLGWTESGAGSRLVLEPVLLLHYVVGMEPPIRHCRHRQSAQRAIEWLFTYKREAGLREPLCGGRDGADGDLARAWYSAHPEGPLPQPHWQPPINISVIKEFWPRRGGRVTGSPSQEDAQSTPC